MKRIFMNRQVFTMVSRLNFIEETRDVGICIVLHLGYFDVQKLACTSRALAKFLCMDPNDDGSNADLKRVVYWLRDLEVLRSLRCSGHLFHKISKAIYNQNYRVMDFEEGAYDEPRVYPEKTLFDVFEKSFPLKFFGSATDFQFCDVHFLDLEERELEIGEMFDDVNCKETHANLQEAHKEGLKCDYAHCKQKFISRVFYVDKKAVCGKCIDETCLLKLRFCAEFYEANSSSFKVKELDYCDEKDSPSRWGLSEGEFWAQFWYTAPYNYAELRFVGAGQRQATSRKRIRET